MKSILFVGIMMLVSIIHSVCNAQNENNVWMFGRNYSLDFNHNPPLLRDDTYLNGTPYASTSQTVMPNSQHKYNYAQAVCDENGNLLFMVKNYVYSSGVPSPSIFDRDEEPIAGTGFLTPNDGQHCRPVVVPHPGNSNQYFIFYIRNGGLIYCLFDLSLNNGKGDILPGQKNVLHFGYNNLVSGKLLAVQGCNGIWLITRHRIHNQYLSFKIDNFGLSTNPVISEVGQMSPNDYYGDVFEMVASPNGKMLATIVFNGDLNNLIGGTELYDFEKCSGKIKNARFLDANSSFSYGLGFSPDNSKLYVAYSEYNASYAQISDTRRDHKLYQFDLSSGNMTDIENSKTLIFTNPTINTWEPFCPFNTPMIGGLRLGPDQKLYMTNGAKQVCPGTGGIALAIHVINSPNQQGLACNPLINHIYNSQNGMDNGPTLLTRTNFPTEIVKAPEMLPDTIVNENFFISACFKEETLLKSPVGVSCIEWNTGATDTSITVRSSGTYWVRYFKDCTVFVDTIVVDFAGMPTIDRVQYGCPGHIQLKAGHADGQSFGMVLYNSFNGKIYENSNASIHYVSNLDEGTYRLRIVTNNGCDTTMDVELKAYPSPEVSISPPVANIAYGEEVVLKANGASHYIWDPVDFIDSPANAKVIAKPKIDTRFMAVGVNEYGCRDTVSVMVTVGYHKIIPMPNAFTPNGDGKNDVFKIPEGSYQVRRFEVYNRYGQQVFNGGGSNAGWDGRFNGMACDAVVYFYIIEIDFPDGTSVILKNDISLLR